MNKSSWSTEDIAEYESICEQAAEKGGTGARTDCFVALLDDALQAHRFWAADVEREIRRSGAQDHHKAWMKRRPKPVLVTYSGQTFAKPRIAGVKRLSESGAVVDVQTLFDYMTWKELEAQVLKNRKAILSLEANVVTAILLLDLRDAVPAASCPTEALVSLGLSMQQWLDKAAA